ncbi:MAG: DEAD/DEAH box helicase, partial [Pseudomonadota bacterium]
MSLPIVSPPRMSLPIEDVLPAVLAALETGRCAVLEAPPGAGKTTRTPLALLNAPWRVASDGRILMLEPRRVAARAAAARLAESLGEKVGETVGYRIRHERRVSAATRIEVITEGVLTRRLQSDPSLDGVAAVLFDEFHERSIHADLGLALCLEAQGALREDLRLLAMSATLDGAAVAELMGDAPRIRSEGRAHPVETRYLDAPVGPARGQRGRGESGVLERATADLIERALAETKGDVLAFLPGAAEIERTAGLLRTRQDVASDRDIATDNADAIAIAPLYAALPFAAQQLALKPDPEGRRKVVLSSALAETSLTIEGVCVVVDAGRSRRARFDPGVGMSRLVTTRVSKAAAEQRRGRAGRTAPGVCYRLWTRAEEGGFPERDPPEILEADLASFALDLAAWGAGPEALALLDPPPPAALA